MDERRILHDEVLGRYTDEELAQMTIYERAHRIGDALAGLPEPEFITDADPGDEDGI